MALDALRFDGEVLDATGASLGEARFWGSAERSAAGSSWRGWLRITDLGSSELRPGRYRVRATAGWEAEFEPLASRPGRVFEIDLLPIAGVGDAPWPDTTETQAPPFRALWNDTPPRRADDRLDFDILPNPERRANQVSPAVTGHAARETPSLPGTLSQ